LFVPYIVYLGEYAVNKEELIQEVAKKTKSSQKDVGSILASLLETIEKSVSKGKKVTLVGFGTFESRKRAARAGRNPQTGATIKIPAKSVPAFTAGKKFKEMVAGSKK
jgi:DNA-binding protein HU-beta